MPVGLDGGRIIKLGGKLPVKLWVGGYCSFVPPSTARNGPFEPFVAVDFLMFE